MKKYILIAMVTTVMVLAALRPVVATALNETSYAGSAVCRQCHEKFYTLWSTSWHGKSSRPYTDEIAEKELDVQKDDIESGPYHYRAKTGKKEGYVAHETGPEGKRQYRIEYIIGGKRTYNFLTILPNGRHQALPVGYDREKGEWFDDVTISADIKEKNPTDWKANPTGFYTACPSCHVSQLLASYDITTATYGSDLDRARHKL